LFVSLLLIFCILETFHGTSKVFSFASAYLRMPTEPLGNNTQLLRIRLYFIQQLAFRSGILVLLFDLLSSLRLETVSVSARSPASIAILHASTHS